MPADGRLGRFKERVAQRSTTAEAVESSVEEVEPIVVRSNRAHSTPVVIDLTDSDVEPNPESPRFCPPHDTGLECHD